MPNYWRPVWKSVKVKSKKCFSRTDFCAKINSQLIIVLKNLRLSHATVSHCTFSSNLFHGQIAQIYIDHLSGPKNKKCSPWKVFGTNHSQTLQLLSRRGPRSREARLSQHYIGPKMTFQHFSNFCRKKFPGLTKRLLHIFIQFWGLSFAKIMWQDLYFHSISAGNPFYQAWKLFSAEIWKMSECHFWADVMLR